MIRPAIGFILAVFPLILLHELGHLLIGKLLGARPKVFSVGFGKSIYEFRWANILWKIGWIPLGGYVSFEKGQFTFEKGISGVIDSWRWIFIAIAGPLMNTVVACALTFVLFFSVFSRVQYQILGGSTYIKVENRTALLDSVYGLTDGGNVFRLDSETGEFKPIVPGPQSGFKDSSLGFRTLKSFNGTKFMMKQMTIETTKALMQIFSKKEGYKNVSGPIGIARVIDSSSRAGLDSLLYIIAALSFALGYFNMLPLVFLDGGRALLALIQTVTNIKTSETLYQRLSIIGIVFFALLFFAGTFSDILRLRG